MQSEYPNIGCSGYTDKILNPDLGVRKDFQGRAISKLRKTEGLVGNSMKGCRPEERHWHPGELTFWLEQNERSQRSWGWRGDQGQVTAPNTMAGIESWLRKYLFMLQINLPILWMRQMKLETFTACWARKEPRAADSQYSAHPLYHQLFDSEYFGKVRVSFPWVVLIITLVRLGNEDLWDAVSSLPPLFWNILWT